MRLMYRLGLYQTVLMLRPDKSLFDTSLGLRKYPECLPDVPTYFCDVFDILETHKNWTGDAKTMTS